MLFSLVKVALALIFVTKTVSMDLEQELSISTQPTYYDCGSWMFFESLIQNMLYTNGIDIFKNAVPFMELLYDLEENYWKIIIPEHLSAPNSIHLTIGQMGQIVDVVTVMKNGHYIKCKRVDESTPGPSNIGPNDYGFECGHDLFSHAIVKMSADLARSNKAGNKLFRIPYEGPYYWPGTDYSIYPICREKNQHYSGKKPENTYYVVINPAGEIMDVVAQLINGDFIRCDRTTKVPPITDSDQDLRLGYLCELEFFEINHMKRTAKLAKARKPLQGQHTYPKEYNHNFFKGFMYPLHPNGRFHGTVPGPIKYFIIMDLHFNVKFAAVKTKMGEITPCEESMRGIEISSPEKDNFICRYNNIEFENEILLEIVETACKALGSIQRRFPAIYSGPDFNVHG
ncbi:hypothetical protein EPUL_005287, partial [Erysiphe pulchra]